eukprot:4173796-Amphidinium_carterae.2
MGIGLSSGWKADAIVVLDSLCLFNAQAEHKQRGVVHETNATRISCRTHSMKGGVGDVFQDFRAQTLAKQDDGWMVDDGDDDADCTTTMRST